MIKQSGQILVLAIIAVAFVLINTLVIISGATLYSQNSNYSLQSTQAIDLAEAGINKAIASLNKSGGSYNGEVETFLGNGSYSVTVTNKDATTKVLQVTSYIPNKSNPKVKRTISVQASTGNGISFIYGMLIGTGGLSMGNGAKINGSIYSNGNIVGGNIETITGDIFVAGGTQPSANQQSDCDSVNCHDYIFGKNIGGENRQDVAQSFKPSVNGVLNKVSIKLKKVGSPANLAIKILGNANGKPNKDAVLATGTLSANLVSNQYDFIDVTFNVTPTLDNSQKYWILSHSSALDNSNYWVWSLDFAQSYIPGSPAWSSDWQAKNPVWTNITGDLGFKTWMGGVVTTVSMGNGSVVQGNVHANTINGITIDKDAYYQVITNSVVSGSSCPNSHCHPDSTDPPPAAMPISDANISAWKSDAEDYGVTVGDINGCPATIGPGKFIGNFVTGNSCTILVKTPIWLTGHLTVGNSVILKMDSSLGASSGVIIVDGKTIFANGDNLLGTGSSGSYLTLLSTFDSQSSNETAINTGNSSITGILYAPFGRIVLANNANFKEAVAWKLEMGTGTILTYDSGLISTFFSAGPSGAYSLIKGTYQLK